MKGLLLTLVVIALAFSSPATCSADMKWLSLKEGMEKARIEQKPMIVDFFFGKGCPRCEALEKGVYGNASIAAKIMSDFIPIRVDLTRELSAEEEQLGNRFDFKNDCLLLFLDAEGNVLKDPLGKRLCFADTVEPDMFIKYLDAVKKQLKE